MIRLLLKPNLPPNNQTTIKYLANACKIRVVYGTQMTWFGFNASALLLSIAVNLLIVSCPKTIFMRSFLLFFSLALVLTSCSQTFYIVRHAEKAVAGNATMMSNDPPLTEAGRERAEALKDLLKTKKIGAVFSTNTLRTKSTAEPTRAYFHLVTETYSSVPDSSFISRIKSIKKNSLIVGHSNTVDDIVNKLCGSVKIPGDLPETEYDNLFIVKKKGRKMSFENKKYGNPSQ